VFLGLDGYETGSGKDGEAQFGLAESSGVEVLAGPADQFAHLAQDLMFSPKSRILPKMEEGAG
jgi:hypothetical protein